MPICALHLRAPGCRGSRPAHPSRLAPRIRGDPWGEPRDSGFLPGWGGVQTPQDGDTAGTALPVSAHRSPAPWRAEGLGEGRWVSVSLLDSSPQGAAPNPGSTPAPRFLSRASTAVRGARQCGVRVTVPLSSPKGPAGVPRRARLCSRAPPGRGARARRGGAGGGGGDLTPPSSPSALPPLPPARTPVPPRPRPPPPTQHRQASQTRSGGGSEAGVRGDWAGSLSGGRSAGKAGGPALGTRPRLRRPRSPVPGPSPAPEATARAPLRWARGHRWGSRSPTQVPPGSALRTGVGRGEGARARARQVRATWVAPKMRSRGGTRLVGGGSQTRSVQAGGG